MQPQKYTDEQIADIEAREKEALETLTRLQLNPSAIIHKVNLGNDTFADKVTPYLADLKYAQPSSGLPTGVPQGDVTPKPDESPVA